MEMTEMKFYHMISISMCDIFESTDGLHAIAKVSISITGERTREG